MRIMALEMDVTVMRIARYVRGKLMLIAPHVGPSLADSVAREPIVVKKPRVEHNAQRSWEAYELALPDEHRESHAPT